MINPLSLKNGVPAKDSDQFELILDYYISIRANTPILMKLMSNHVVTNCRRNILSIAIHVAIAISLANFLGHSFRK